MMDPDFQIRGGGGHLDPEIRGAQSPKKFFFALWASFWSKNKGGAGHSGPSPESAAECSSSSNCSMCSTSSYSYHTFYCHYTQWRIRGACPPPPYFSSKMRPKGRKKVCLETSPPPSLRVWMTATPPPYLKVWIRH